MHSCVFLFLDGIKCPQLMLFFPMHFKWLFSKIGFENIDEFVSMKARSVKMIINPVFFFGGAVINKIFQLKVMF